MSKASVIHIKRSGERGRGKREKTCSIVSVPDYLSIKHARIFHYWHTSNIVLSVRRHQQICFNSNTQPAIHLKSIRNISIHVWYTYNIFRLQEKFGFLVRIWYQANTRVSTINTHRFASDIRSKIRILVGHESRLQTHLRFSWRVVTIQKWCEKHGYKKDTAFFSYL